MPQRCRRRLVCYCVVASLLTVALWLGACTPVSTGPTPTPAPAPATALVPGTPRAPADLGCLLVRDQGSDQPVWLVKGGEPPRLVAHGDWSLLSPDGRTVAYGRGFPNELWIAGTDGSSPTLVYTAPMGSPLIGNLHLAPDGTLAVFGLTGPGSPASQDPGALWRVDVPSRTSRLLVEAGAHYPLFSPDGRWLSLASPLGTLASHGTVGLIDVAGQGEPALFEFVLVRDRAWAADSSGFVVAFEGMGADPVGTELWWVPASGPPTRLGELTGVLDLTWQPGGERLVYRKEGSGTPRLYLASRDGRGEVSIPGSDWMFPRAATQLPAWSPDGRWLLTMQENGTPALLDVEGPVLHSLDVQVVYGWLDAGHYLASIIQGEDLERYRQGGDMAVDLSRCAPLGPCEWLAEISRLAYLSYAPHCP